MVLFEEAGGLVGFSERYEHEYGSFLRQSSRNPDGTWHLPPGRYGLREGLGDDSNEIRAWHWWWDAISDQDARAIAGMDAP